MKKIATVLASFLFAACASAPKSTPPKEATNNPPVTAKSEAAIISAPEKNVSVSPAEIEARNLASELQSLQKKSVYFDFDKHAVKSEYLDIVRQQAEFIKAHKNGIVTIEGNADERGSGEYNLALGDKRANAIRKNLELLGVPASQIKAVSLGEEKPRLLCHSEKCWQENRRGDFSHKLN